jgi:hypothetical protein
MKNGKLKSFAASLILVFLLACTKQGPAGPAGSEGTPGNANVKSVLFTGITVPMNNTYTFQIPEITQAIVDSGTVSVFYKGAQAQDTWYPLPQYYYYNGGLVWLILSDIQVGQATLSNYGLSAFTTTYRFDIIAGN